MKFTNSLRNKVKDLLDGNYDGREIRFVPTVDNVSLGKKYLNTKLCAMFIDLRNSSDLLINRWKQSSAKVHKAYITVVVDVVNRNGGMVRSFQGDGILSFWPAYYKSQISQAVRSAMIIKGLLDNEFRKYFEKYFDLDFGIGVDFDDAYVIRAGSTDKKENNDLVYITKAVNKAVKLANVLEGPDHIGITERTYFNLENDLLYDEDEDNIWYTDDFEWGDYNEDFYRTSGYFEY